MEDTLKIISLNCRGLANDFKRRDTLNFLREKKPDIILLQDIHIGENNANRIILEWGFEGFISPGSSRSRGVAILFNNTFSYKINQVKKCPDGNYVLAKVSFLNRTVAVGSIYGPNEDNPEFYKELFKEVQSMECDEILLGGDWNLVMDPSLDYVSYSKINNKKARQTLLDEIQNFELVDIWRTQHCDARNYTWSTDKKRKRARLDYFLTSEGIANITTESNISLGYRSDHSMIDMKLSKDSAKRGRGYWKFNVALLREENYSNLVIETIKECFDLYAALPYSRENIDTFLSTTVQLTISYKLFLDTLLMMIRRETIKYCSKRKEKKKKDEEMLMRTIDTLEEEINANTHQPSEELLNDLYRKKDELEAIRKERVKGIIIRSRARWYEEGERNTAYFLNLENRNYTDRQMHQIILDNGERVRNGKQILQEIENYYCDI